MATNELKSPSEEAKTDLFEDDDEFEEFEIDLEWDSKEEGKEVTQQWEDDWDDDDVNDDFSLQLRRRLSCETGQNEQLFAYFCCTQTKNLFIAFLSVVTIFFLKKWTSRSALRGSYLAKSVEMSTYLPIFGAHKPKTRIHAIL